ncbi:MAG: sodium-dependent transporter [Pseudomonadota bacterium]
MTPSSKSDASRPRGWSSRFVFLMAAIGAAVGLGNLWRFPFQTGENGGAAFVVLYLLCIVFIGFPVLLGELAIGRAAPGSAIRSIRGLAAQSGASSLWSIGGWIGASASILVLPIYSIIAGKIMAYSAMAFAGLLTTETTTQPALYGGSTAAVIWTTAFLGATVFIVSRGLKNGVEAAVSLLMPMFFLLLAGLSIASLIIGDAGAAAAYLFNPRWADVTAATVLAALGQALFSLAVGGAVMIAYGALLPDDERLPGAAAIIALSDTLVALIAGLMIFPIVFAHALDPAAGMGLIFEALPPVFLSLPAGQLIGGLFFTLAFVAALTSSISMLLMSSRIGEDAFSVSRSAAIALFGGGAFIVGIASTLNHDLSEIIDFAVSGVLLPLGALSSALIAGWVAPRAVMRAQTHGMTENAFLLWRFLLRYAAPTAIAAIFVFGIDETFQFGLAQALSRLG